MHPDYYNNPPNMKPPVNKYYYAIMFINNKNIEMKGQANIYRRKTLDMLMDLINDLDEIYFHSDVQGDQQYLAEQTQNIDCYLRVIYTEDFNEVLSKINPNAYVIKYSWNDIPNCNPIPFRPPCPPPRDYPPYPRIYAVKQHMYDTNQVIEKFGDEE